MSNREEAKRLLVHYFRLLASKSGLKWDGDNDTAVGDIVDCIIAATKEEREASGD